MFTIDEWNENVENCDAKAILNVEELFAPTCKMGDYVLNKMGTKTGL